MKIIQIPVLQDNYAYLAICEITGLAAVIDSPDAPAVRNAAKRAGVEIVAIFNTHHHWDHIGSNEDLLSKKKMSVYASAYDKDRVPGVTSLVADGMTIALGDLRFDVIEAPGHTLGHVLYYGHGALFCGDTLFVGGCGRLFEGTPEQMVESLRKIASLPQHTQIYCAHEYTQKNLEFCLQLNPENIALQKKYEDVIALRKKNLPTVPTTLAEELAYNPFLRASINADKQTAIHEFTKIRELRNNY